MHSHVTTLLGVVLLAGCLRGADIPDSRQGVVLDFKSFPQTSPKEVLASVLKAAELKRIDYLLAQLTDPDEISARSEVLAGGFKDVVKEAADKLDAASIKKLKRFLLEGEFETLENRAVVRLKDVPNRVVRLRKIEQRWYLQNPSKP